MNISVLIKDAYQGFQDAYTYLNDRLFGKELPRLSDYPSTKGKSLVEIAEEQHRFRSDHCIAQNTFRVDPSMALVKDQRNYNKPIVLLFPSQTRKV
ncbi:hypothetical protein [Gimesia fumaroli]|uniref:Uncharacterized protein n=1 Tax=Gimesia fumaroli TaxID=2527976 RepID=A0A518I5P1_9PLAN|nr:hypothetical protein [Gimesia fumaroli]QDV48419.1 hypothetical protein Enr17x_04310 [Gimesia fumaroli]